MGRSGPLSQAIPDFPGMVDTIRGRFAGQIHEFNPPIFPGGLFWTIPLERDMVTSTDSTVSFVAPHLPMWDYFNLPNSLAEGPEGQNTGKVPRVPAIVSHDCQWTAKGDEIEDVNERLRFRYTFRHADVSMGWSAETPDSLSVVEKGDGYQVIAAYIGDERNGVYF